MAKRGKTIDCTGPVLQCFDACEAEDLLQGMTDWAESMENANVEHLEKYEEVSACRDALESAELNARLETLAEALEVATEGKSFRQGCPPHVVGSRCKRCGWGGLLPRPFTAPTLWEGAELRPDGNRVNYNVAKIVSRGYTSVHTANILNKAEVGDARERARREWWADCERATTRNALLRTIPARLEDEPAVEPVVELGGDVSWQEWRGYGKRALVLSRADRMSNAQASIEAGLDALDGLREVHAAADENAPGYDALNDVVEAADEVVEALSELDGIDFPWDAMIRLDGKLAQAAPAVALIGLWPLLRLGAINGRQWFGAIGWTYRQALRIESTFYRED